MAETALAHQAAGGVNFQRGRPGPGGLETKPLARWTFQHCLQCRAATLLHRLLAEGWKPDKLNAHHRTISSLPIILGKERQDDADYLDACRGKRNGLEYDAAGKVSAAEAKELREFAVELRETVLVWLGEKHPKLSPRGK